MVYTDEDENKWVKVLWYVGPVVLFSLLFNLPTFFEFYCTEEGKNFIENFSTQGLEL